MNYAGTTLAIACLAAGVAFAPGHAREKAPLAGMAGLKPGLYELHEFNSTQTERICIANARDLVQLRHRGKPCSSHVLKDSERLLVVHYTCKGQGYGMTTVRSEASNLGVIDSQGIANGAPFAFRSEIRRMGSC